MPTIHILIDKLHDLISFFFKLGLRLSYHQIRMTNENVYLISIHTRDGHYEFSAISFRLTNNA